MPHRTKALSFCMIAKNEAGNLAGCLDSVRDLAAESIVVDTGSTDATRTRRGRLWGGGDPVRFQ